MRRLLPGASSCIALLMVSAPLSVAAVLAFPIWDDGWLWLLLNEEGPHAITESFADRPINAAIWAVLASSGRGFWRAAIAAQAVLWPLLGALSALLWSRFFPRQSRYAALVACVAVAPLATKVQMVTANVALASLLSTMIAYLGAIALLDYVRGVRGSLALAAAVALFWLGILVQEYALPVALIGAVLLAFELRGGGETRARAAQAAIALAATVAGAYSVHLFVADLAIRPEVQPSYPLKLGGAYHMALPARLASALWWGIVGGPAAALGRVALDSLPGILSAAYGLAVAALLAMACHTAPSGYGAPNRRAEPRSAPAFFAALVVAAIPIVAMGRTPWDPDDGMSSRFGIPLLPVAAPLSVFLATAFIRRRYWAAPVVLLGFAAGHAAAFEAWSAIREREFMTKIGRALRPWVAQADGHTLAAIHLPERSLGPRRQWELAARVSQEWPAGLRQKFWAYRAGGGAPLPYDEEAGKIFGARGQCRAPDEIDVRVRHVARRGQVGQLLWIEPYCLKE